MARRRVTIPLITSFFLFFLKNYTSCSPVLTQGSPSRDLHGLHGGEAGRHLHGTGLPTFPFSLDRTGWNYLSHYGKFGGVLGSAGRSFFWACYALGVFDYALSGREAQEGWRIREGGVETTLCIHFLPFSSFICPGTGMASLMERLTNLQLVTGCVNQRVLGKNGMSTPSRIRRETRPGLGTNVR